MRLNRDEVPNYSRRSMYARDDHEPILFGVGVVRKGLVPSPQRPVRRVEETAASKQPRALLNSVLGLGSVTIQPRECRLPAANMCVQEVPHARCLLRLVDVQQVLHRVETQPPDAFKVMLGAALAL